MEKTIKLKHDEEKISLEEALNYFDDQIDGLFKEMVNIREHLVKLIEKIKQHTHDSSGRAVIAFESF